MCTAFPYCRFGVQRLLEMIYEIISTGGFVAGPRTLRPERLQWLTTSAANRQASIRTILWSLTVGPFARAAPNRSIYRVDTVRSGALEELAFSRKDAASRGGSPPEWMRVVVPALSPTSVTPAKAGAQLYNGLCCPKRGASLRWHDDVRESAKAWQLRIFLSRASVHFFTRILHRIQAWTGHSLLPIRSWKAEPSCDEFRFPLLPPRMERGEQGHAHVLSHLRICSKLPA